MRNPNFGRGALVRETNQTKDRKIDKCLSPLWYRTWLIKYFFYIERI